MVRFINPDNGMVFDGSQPYVFWFDEGQSVNLNYVKKIFFASTDAHAEVSMTSPVFSLLDVSGIERHVTSQEVFDGEHYYDLQEMKTRTLSLTGTETDTGSGIYVYAIYILAFCKSVGEVTDEFDIDGTKYTVGADFYAEDERLTTTLANFGIEIPYDVQKAVYEQNVHEEAQNNILLNRKYKELLANYWDIVANKGNYRSLQKSLDWFEYGDLVTLREFWNEPGTNYNYYDKICTVVDEEIMMRMQAYMKKTYIGVYFALQHMVLDDNGDIVYDGSDAYIWNYTGNVRNATLIPVGASEDPLSPDDINQDRLLQIGGGEVNVENHTLTDPDAVGSNWGHLTAPAAPEIGDGNEYFLYEMNPVLAPTVALYNATDIALKMTLLGNYYSTFFVPIQLDLIHATVESIVYATTIKILNTTQMYRYDTQCLSRSIDAVVNSDFKLQPIKDLYVYPETMFGGYDAYVVDHGTYSSLKRIGVEFARENEAGSLNAMNDTYMSVTYFKWGGIGCLVDFTFTIPLGDGDYITREKICVGAPVDSTADAEAIPWQERVDMQREEFRVLQPNEDGNVVLEFKVLLQDAGDTTVSLMFTAASGIVYTYGRTFNIEPWLTHDNTIYRVMKMSPAEIYAQLSAQNGYNVEVNDYIMSQFHLYGNYDDPNAYIYRQYINCGPDVGLTHVMAVRAVEDQENSCIIVGRFDGNIRKAKYMCNDTANVELYTNGNDIAPLVATLEASIPAYYWYSNEVFDYRGIDNDVSSRRKFIIVGICKTYDSLDASENDHVRICNYSNGVYTPARHIGSLRFKDKSLFLPMLHKYVSAGDDYVFRADEVICVVPGARELYKDEYLLTNGGNFTRLFDGCVWEFVNTSTGRVYASTMGSVQQPFVLPYDRVVLDRGYYDIVMRYNYGDDGVEPRVRRQSSFVIS